MKPRMSRKIHKSRKREALLRVKIGRVESMLAAFAQITKETEEKLPTDDAKARLRAIAEMRNKSLAGKVAEWREELSSDHFPEAADAVR